MAGEKGLLQAPTPRSETDVVSEEVTAALRAVRWHKPFMRIATAGDAAALLRPFFEGAEEERVAVIYLDAERRLIGVTREGSGGTDDVELPIPAILGRALRLGAASLVVAHNHPSGDPQPSQSDLESTRRLAAAVASTGLRLVDHLIFVEAGACSSFVALGLL